ncbi:phosphatase PAP2 family protein [Ramlibacter algicola]|uniref:Phosphatase PAP2 family protein n=1 Tax=Ramlibacter algicola TaxID=2795217 RepID=A0A934Q0L5_9BURK|nr:phosphatase PAP2 family protein [Ramlibacter algicola]MBK0392538.1 phosphatase PAP2 family protein [Ramlibacter algicola]
MQRAPVSGGAHSMLLRADAMAVNPITSLDHAILSGLNGFARTSWAFDNAVALLTENDLTKGAVAVAALWWAWFRREQGREATVDRAHVIATILSCLAALAVGRLLVIALPFRVRPIHDAELGFLAPYGAAGAELAKASSFPSDHAVLFFALATGLFFVSRRAGVLAALYAFAVVALPRLYLGLHYFSDIVAGAAIGVAACWIGNLVLPASRGVQRILAASTTRPALFHFMLFVVTFEIAELFDSSRAIAGRLLMLFT